MDNEQLRLAVYRSFAQSGRPPQMHDLAERLASDVPTVSTGLKELAAARHLVLDELGRIIMAHPFSAVPLGFSVMGRQALWWGGCAWDSFALPHLLPGEGEVLVATRCPACSRPHAWNVGTQRPPAAARSPTSWSLRRGCGTTSCTPAGMRSAGLAGPFWGL